MIKIFFGIVSTAGFFLIFLSLYLSQILGKISNPELLSIVNQASLVSLIGGIVIVICVSCAFWAECYLEEDKKCTSTP
jgi:hypothetical protein